MNLNHTRELVKKHEGVRYRAYHDTKGILTVGVGFNLEKEGAATRIAALGIDYHALCAGACSLADAHVDTLFTVDLQDSIDLAPAIVSNFDQHPDDVKSVIVDMIYNLGPRGFARFVKAIEAFEHKDYCRAAAEMKDSNWAREVPNRASENIGIVSRYCNKQAI